MAGPCLVASKSVKVCQISISFSHEMYELDLERDGGAFILAAIISEVSATTVKRLLKASVNRQSQYRFVNSPILPGGCGVIINDVG